MRKTKSSKTTTLNVVETRKNIGRIIEDVYYNNKRYIIARRGKPYALLISAKPIQLVKSKTEKTDFIEIAEAAQKLQKKTVNLNKLMSQIRR